MSASQAALPPPNSEKWFEHPPHVAHMNYQSQLDGELLIYVSLAYSLDEMKAHSDKFCRTPDIKNSVTKKLTRAIQGACSKRKINYETFRECYDKTRSWYIAHRRGERGDELEEGVKAHHTHQIRGHSGLSDNPTLQELKLFKQATAPIDWWLKTARFLKTYSDDQAGLEKLQIAWGHKNINSTKIFKNDILNTAAAMEGTASPIILPEMASGDGQADTGDDVVVVTCQIFPPSNYVTRAATEAGFSGSHRKEPVKNQGPYNPDAGTMVAIINTQAVTPAALKLFSETHNRQAPSAGPTMTLLDASSQDSSKPRDKQLTHLPPTSSIAAKARTPAILGSVSRTSSHEVAVTTYTGSYMETSALGSNTGVVKRIGKGKYAGTAWNSIKSKYNILGPSPPTSSSREPVLAFENFTANPNGSGLAFLSSSAAVAPASAFGSAERLKRVQDDARDLDSLLSRCHDGFTPATAASPDLAPMSLQLGDPVGSSSSASKPIPPPSHAVKRSVSLAAHTSMPSPKRLKIRDTTKSSSSSAVPNLSPPQATGRKTKKMAKPTVLVKPLYTPEGMLDGEEIEGRAVVALYGVRDSLHISTPAVLTSPDTLLATFDPLHDKFEGLGETWATKGNFYYLCEYTTIFRNPDAGSKDVDNFVAWFMEGFLDGPKTSGTFLDGLTQALAAMKTRDEKRKADEEADEEQFLLDSDAAEEVNPKFM